MINSTEHWKNKWISIEKRQYFCTLNMHAVHFLVKKAEYVVCLEQLNGYFKHREDIKKWIYIA